MEIEAKEIKTLDDGTHSGIMKRIEYREEPFRYTDIYIGITDEDKNFELKVGYPTSISEKSSLGKLLMRFGVEIIAKQTYDPEKILIGKACVFQTITENVKDAGDFARIIPESVKPK